MSVESGYRPREEQEPRRAGAWDALKRRLRMLGMVGGLLAAPSAEAGSLEEGMRALDAMRASRVGPVPMMEVQGNMQETAVRYVAEVGVGAHPDRWRMIIEFSAQHAAQQEDLSEEERAQLEDEQVREFAFGKMRQKRDGIGMIAELGALYEELARAREEAIVDVKTQEVLTRAQESTQREMELQIESLVTLSVAMPSILAVDIPVLVAEDLERPFSQEDIQHREEVRATLYQQMLERMNEDPALMDRAFASVKRDLQSIKALRNGEDLRFQEEPAIRGSDERYASGEPATGENSGLVGGLINTIRDHTISLRLQEQLDAAEETLRAGNVERAWELAHAARVDAEREIAWQRRVQFIALVPGLSPVLSTEGREMLALQQVQERLFLGRLHSTGERDTAREDLRDQNEIDKKGREMVRKILGEVYTTPIPDFKYHMPDGSTQAMPDKKVREWIDREWLNHHQTFQQEEEVVLNALMTSYEELVSDMQTLHARN